MGRKAVRGMKAIRSMSKEERKVMSVEIRKRCVEICKQFELDYDTMAIYILHFYYGFGEKRIKEYHKHLVRERAELKEWYGSDKGQDETDIHFFAMREKLKAKGIDVEAISKEVMLSAKK
jgi:hypothetical protein